MDTVHNPVGDVAQLPGQLALFPDPRRVADRLPPDVFRFHRFPRWALVDASWPAIHLAERWAEDLDRQAWLDELVERWGLVLMDPQ